MTLDIDHLSYVATWERKLEQYYASHLPYTVKNLAELGGPIRRVSIVRLYTAAAARQDDSDVLGVVAGKLVDIKSNLVNLLSADLLYWHEGALIVGNREYEKLTPATLHVLRKYQYQVFLISVLIEQTLDLLQLLLEGRLKDVKTGKWSKRLEMVHLATADLIVTPPERDVILAFQEKFRTAELHKFSAVRAFTAKPKWSSFAAEQELILALLARTADYLAQDRPSDDAAD